MCSYAGGVKLVTCCLLAGFKVLQTSQFMVQDAVHMADRLKHIISDFPLLAVVDMGCEVTHLALSCDDLTLAVATADTGNNFLHAYDVRNFESKVCYSVSMFKLLLFTMFTFS